MSLKDGGHTVEEIDGVRCAVVEMDASPERIAFLKKLLAHNGYEVKTEQSPPPKVAKPKPGEEAAPPPEAPNTFTIGVTDIIFNAVNEVYKRALKTFDGEPVSPAYWNQTSDDTKKWYWES